jgi:hypothetical protein
MDQFENLTWIRCGKDCNPTRCVISGKPYCAHPCMGALQAADEYDPAVIERRRLAKLFVESQPKPVPRVIP